MVVFIEFLGLRRPPYRRKDSAACRLRLLGPVTAHCSRGAEEVLLLQRFNFNNDSTDSNLGVEKRYVSYRDYATQF